MKERQDCAINGFYNGQNCAQSVITAYANEFGMDTIQTLKIAGAFGAGMSRLQQTCGAVTGSYMLIGLNNSNKIADKDQLQKTNISLVQEFQKRFVSMNGTDQCKDLIKTDLNTDEGQEYFKKEELKEKVCSRCINSAIEILDSLF